MGIVEIFGFAVPVITTLLKEFNVLKDDDKIEFLNQSGPLLANLIDGLTKMKDNDPIDLASLKLEKTFAELLAERNATTP